MSWILVNDTLSDNKQNVICSFLPNVNEEIVRMIKNSNEIIDLVGRFVQTYDESKKISKKLFNEFESMVNPNADYNFYWEIGNNGLLTDNVGNIICVLSDKDSINSKIIKFLPEVFAAAQMLVKTYNSSKDVKQKPIYENICRVYDRISQLS